MGDVDVDALLNRELSWLDFNARVLAQACEQTVPLLERVKFVAICSANLDEFFQVRVSALKNQVDAGITALGPDGRSPARVLLEVGDLVADLVAEQERIVIGDLLPAMRAEGIELVSPASLDDRGREEIAALFRDRLFPVLTPLAVDPAHPFPYISNLSLNLAVMVSDPEDGERRFARVKVPSLLPRLVALPDGVRFVPLEEVIAAQLGDLFPGMRIEEHWFFRVTRNTDFTVAEDEAEDLLEALEIELRRRRFGRAVRLEAQAGMPPEMLSMLLDELDLDEDDVTLHRTLIDLTALFQLVTLERPALRDEPWKGVTPSRVQAIARGEKTWFETLRERDVFVHHPYESFGNTVESFVAAAADDPKVQSIKMTLYRMSDDSDIADSLARAAERGVQVAVLVELKARFDEQSNITWARKLERSGVHVMFGLVGLKTHSKCALVVRDDDDGLHRYAHIGTGNYNSRTARVYEDIGLFTADPEIGADLGELFNHLTGYSKEERYRKIVVAPTQLRLRLHELIDNEIACGTAGEITAKVNSIVDSDLIRALYRASAVGVRINLVVRGICCLRPGVPGLSENIRVRSVVGRYLEHSRILRFANGSGRGKPLHLIGSADLMERNLDRRVEVLVPVRDRGHRTRLDNVLEELQADDAAAWELGSDGQWVRRGDPAAVHPQTRIHRLNQRR
ncbi:MAG: polyphosphate kinase 1 [Actinobacteria bacterium]|uniref:ATP-polyphosphate phosphotransferase n=1 Tax=freshwater metagenome TaxID=449393 RepID=A0A6J6XUQ7_9ZZZZ|nr:polyphosphate kinase 1 [Actinomycetota bacterium]